MVEILASDSGRPAPQRMICPVCCEQQKGSKAAIEAVASGLEILINQAY